MCDTLPTMSILHNIYSFQIILMSKMCRSSLTTQKSKWDATLPNTEVPQLNPTTFEYWNTAFAGEVGRQTSLSVISLCYLLCSNSVGCCNLGCPTREGKLCNCVSLTRQRIKTDSDSLYSLLVQYIGTVGCISNILNNYNRSNNIRTCCLEIKSHYQNYAYL